VAQDPLDHHTVLDDRQVPHLATTVGADERVHLVDFFDQPDEGAEKNSVPLA
tara:strand:- start:1487 stop:1642 length:156 start_codon:yes stop_codon:yes gene_type:complete